MNTVSLHQDLLIKHTISALPPEERDALRKCWNDRIKDPLAFVPHDERETVSEGRAHGENVRFGAFAAEYLKRVINGLRPMKDNGQIVGVGFGKGYDAGWLEHAANAGLRTSWIDVSDDACAFARENLAHQAEGLGERVIRPAYRIIQGEIQSVLADPEPYGLDIETVQIWYFCRLLGCLTENSARLVLKYIGAQSLSSLHDPSCKNAVVIINTLRDYNPCVTGKTSFLWSKRALVKNLKEGAGRPIRVTKKRSYPYYGKTVSAMTFMAARE